MRPRKPRAIALRQLGWAALVAFAAKGVVTASLIGWAALRALG
jgi:hypothetical protein